jgi:hypothetical protein
MKRKSIPENGSFRYIHKDDIEQSFDNRLRSLNNLELSDFYNYNVENRHVFVYDFDNRVLCVLVFDDKDDHFYLNLIENNEVYGKECDEVNPAPKLITYVEKIAKSLGHKKIRLDSLEQLVPYYTKLGYSSMNDDEHHKDYGLLVKMKKLFGN